MDSFSILLLGILAPLLQLCSLMALLSRRRRYMKRRATLKSVYWTILPAMMPWFTYLVFIYLLLNLWTPVRHETVVVLWASLSLVNRGVLPLTIGLTLLPPYPPQAWMSSIYRASAIAMAIVACYMTQYIFPMEW